MEEERIREWTQQRTCIQPPSQSIPVLRCSPQPSSLPCLPVLRPFLILTQRTCSSPIFRPFHMLTHLHLPSQSLAFPHSDPALPHPLPPPPSLPLPPSPSLSCLPSGERTRWELSISDLESRLSKLPGDVVVASAFMSYAGPFPSEYRDELVGAWAELRTDADVCYKSYILIVLCSVGAGCHGMEG